MFSKYRLGKSILVGLTTGMVVVTLFFMGLYVGFIQPERVLFKVESKHDFLARVLRDYPGIRFVNEYLPTNAKVMFLWDGRGYYCDLKCLPDVDQSRWSALVQNISSLKRLTNKLEDEKITHILFSREDITYFLLLHDHNGNYLEATKFFLKEFVPKCTDEIFSEEWVQIMEINYSKEDCR